VTFDLSLPVPPLGPATFAGTVAQLTWAVEVKLDTPGLDRSTSAPIVVLQPTALLRAGVVRVGEFALYESADGTSDVGAYTIALRPMPLCIGQAFTGELTFTGAPPSKLQGVRAELRVDVKATVANGLSESIVLWSAPLAAGADVAATYALSGTIPETYLPTIELAHGAGQAVFDVVLDRRMARDVHLRRDVTICSTTEV